MYNAFAVAIYKKINFIIIIETNEDLILYIFWCRFAIEDKYQY